MSCFLLIISGSSSGGLARAVLENADSVHGDSSSPFSGRNTIFLFNPEKAKYRNEVDLISTLCLFKRRLVSEVHHCFRCKGTLSVCSCFI